MLFNKLTYAEKDIIKEYISENMYAGDLNQSRRSPLDFILREWNSQKTNLFNLLGGEDLIISKNLVLEKDVSSLIDAFVSAARNERAFMLFEAEFRNRCSTQYDWKGYYPDLDWKDEYYHLCDLIAPKTLAENKYSGPSFKVELPTGKSIAIQNGCKPVKVLNKFIKPWGMTQDLYENFRILCSQILNDKKLIGELCLSIHPLDYMTMSDNESDWTSCMSWREDGCYRQGTVEMMNSRYVVVAYLKSKSDMDITNNGYTWNNKKWRCLFIVDKGFIVGIKGYPYVGYQIQKEVLNWLADLAEKNLGWKYPEKIHEFDSYRVYDTDISICFETQNMYNDFGNNCTHYIRLAELEDISFDYKESHKIYFDYSGVSECMWCGNLSTSGSESSLICEDCDNRYYCHECGEALDPDDVYWVNDEPYCCCCYDEVFYEDPISNELIHEMDLIRVFLVPDGEELSFDCKYVFMSRSHSEGELSKYFTTTTNKELDKTNHFHYDIVQPDYWSRHEHFVYESECTEKGLEVFRYYGRD